MAPLSRRSVFIGATGLASGRLLGSVAVIRDDPRQSAVGQTKLNATLDGSPLIDNHQGGGEYRGLMVLTGARAMRLGGKVELLTWNSWSCEPLIGCCRHMYGPGQIARFAREMIRTWQRLHVAGEHTRRNDFGMEAAMESGERAALEVLAVGAAG